MTDKDIVLAKQAHDDIIDNLIAQLNYLETLPDFNESCTTLYIVEAINTIKNLRAQLVEKPQDKVVSEFRDDKLEVHWAGNVPMLREGELSPPWYKEKPQGDAYAWCYEELQKDGTYKTVLSSSEPSKLSQEYGQVLDVFPLFTENFDQSEKIARLREALIKLRDCGKGNSWVMSPIDALDRVGEIAREALENT